MTSFHLITAGCSLNAADSEQMAGLLTKAKFMLAETIEEADVIIFNACAVKESIESAFFKKLNEIRENYPYKIIIIAGCIAQANSKELKKYPLVGIKQIHKIVEVVEEALHDNTVHMLENNELPPLNYPHIRKNKYVEIIPLSRGCLEKCSFCKTELARGNLQSYRPEEIVARANEAVRDGVREIRLTSQDTGSYGVDINTDLPALLQKTVELKGNFKIRIGVMYPDYLSKILEKMIRSYQHEKIFKFLHLAVQSGNDDVLKKMNQGYMVSDFKEQVKAFRKIIPNINIMTDIIVGFPGETELQYWDTLNLIREIMPDSINISCFWLRAGKAAAKMKPLSSEVVKHRSKIITDIFNNISKMRNERWLGWEGLVIIDEPGTTGNQWAGRNDYYKKILVEGNFRLGDVLRVKITKAGIFGLQGSIIS